MALYGPPEQRYSPHELLGLIRHLPNESALIRKLRGPLADWDVHAYLLRLIEYNVRAANWQRAGKKGAPKPKPLELPGEAAAKKTADADSEQKLRNLGLVPVGDVTNPPPAAEGPPTSQDEMAAVFRAYLMEQRNLGT